MVARRPRSFCHIHLHVRLCQESLAECSMQICSCRRQRRLTARHLIVSSSRGREEWLGSFRSTKGNSSLATLHRLKPARVRGRKPLEPCWLKLGIFLSKIPCSCDFAQRLKPAGSRDVIRRQVYRWSHYLPRFETSATCIRPMAPNSKGPRWTTHKINNNQ